MSKNYRALQVNRLMSDGSHLPTADGRRQFLKLIIRGGMFTALGLMTGVLLHRRSGEESCRYDFNCSGCAGLDRCGLPQADSYRLEKARLPKKRPTHG